MHQHVCGAILATLVAGITPPAALAAEQAARAATAASTGVSARIGELGSFDYDERTQAARELRRAAPAEVVPQLAAAARAHDDEFVRFRALVLLTGFNDRGTGGLMRELMADPNDRIREVVYNWFALHPDAELTPALLGALQHESAEFVRPALVSALAALGGDPQVQRALLFEIGRGMDFFRSAVIEILGRHRATWAVETIANVARQPGPLQFDAVLALGRIRDPRAVPVLEGLRSAPRDVQVAASTGLCLVAARCETHLADALRAATEPGAPRPVVRAAAMALVVTALDADDLRAASVLYELGGAGELARTEAARGFGHLAIRGPDRLLAWMDRIPEAARPAAVELVADGVGRLEEHFLQEQLFTALRAAYWKAPDDAEGRHTIAALIDTLEF